MSEINYKAEVQKVLPDAVCIHFNEAYWLNERYRVNVSTGISHLPATVGSGYSKKEAWMDAFEQLKQQGEI